MKFAINRVSEVKLVDGWVGVKCQQRTNSPL